MTSLRERSKALSMISDGIKTIENFVANYDAEADRDKIESRLSRLDLLYDRYTEASIAVELAMEETPETKAAFAQNRTEMEDKYYTLVDFLTANKVNRNVSGTPSPASTSVVRLPKIDLPTFDGEMHNWIPFYDAYRSLIHNNRDLAAVDKFHYLMAALKEPVKRLLDTTSITGDNYRIAWDLLVSRYDNKRLLIRNHICALFTIEPVRKESSAALLSLVDQFERHVKILTTLGESTNEWSSLLVHMVCSRLNQSMLREWERSTGNDKEKIPTYDELITFLKDQARILLSLNSGVIAPSPPKDNHRLSVAHTASESPHSPSRSHSCIVCNQEHRIYDCELFKRMPIEEKQDTVRKKRLCWNCLSTSHISRDCSSKPCRKCNEKHHTLLHSFSPNDRTTQPQEETSPGNLERTTSLESITQVPALLSTPTLSTSTPTTQQPLTYALTAASSSTTTFSTVLLSTAVVKVYGPSGRSTFVRTLLDSCSESNFITERIVQLLGLHRQKQASVIAGMGGSTVNSTDATVATFTSVDSTYSNMLTFSILPKITNHLPSRPIDMSQWKLPRDLVLADPDFATPQQIDMVIGAQLFFSLLLEGQIRMGAGPPQHQPILQHTVFGWVISGNVSSNSPTQESETVSLLCTTGNLDQQPLQPLEVEDRSETTSRDESSKLVVRLPRKDHSLSQPKQNLNTNASFSSDSSTTLHWLHNPRSSDNTFVANRIAEVQRFTEGCVPVDPCEPTSNAVECSSLFPAPDVQELPPEVSHDDLLLYGGRLNHSISSFTSLVNDPVNQQLLDTGPRAMGARISERSWPLDLRNLARNLIKPYLSCHRTRLKPKPQLIGQRPKQLAPVQVDRGQNHCCPSRRGWSRPHGNRHPSMQRTASTSAEVPGNIDVDTARSTNPND